MSNWYYYSKTGEKIGPVSATALKELARQGLITSETKVENQNGRTAVAGQINGLTFAETINPEASVYGFDEGSNFPSLTSEGNTPPDYDPFAAVPSSVAPSNYSIGNATARRTSRTVSSTTPKPVLLDWLFLDFRFRFFLTPLFLKIIWCTWVVFIELLILALVFGLLFYGVAYMLPDMSGNTTASEWEGPSRYHGSGSGIGFIGFLVTRILPLIMIPFVAVTFLLCIRIVLECVMIAFRIGEHLKSIDEKT